jgi:hypothetical protein
MGQPILIDNDALLKLARYGLLDEAVALFWQLQNIGSCLLKIAYVVVKMRRVPLGWKHSLKPVIHSMLN